MKVLCPRCKSIAKVKESFDPKTKTYVPEFKCRVCNLIKQFIPEKKDG